MKIFKLTYLGFYLNAVCESGEFNHISTQEIKDQILDGTIFEYLMQNVPERIDFSLLTPDDKTELLDEWTSLAWNYSDSKFCVRNNGISLLVAYLFQGIQSRFGMDTDVKTDAPSRD